MRLLHNGKRVIMVLETDGGGLATPHTIYPVPSADPKRPELSFATVAACLAEADRLGLELSDSDAGALGRKPLATDVKAAVLDALVVDKTLTQRQVDEKAALLPKPAGGGGPVIR